MEWVQQFVFCPLILILKECGKYIAFFKKLGFWAGSMLNSGGSTFHVQNPLFMRTWVWAHGRARAYTHVHTHTQTRNTPLYFDLSLNEVFQSISWGQQWDHSIIVFFLLSCLDFGMDCCAYWWPLISERAWRGQAHRGRKPLCRREWPGTSVSTLHFLKLFGRPYCNISTKLVSGLPLR